MLAVVVLEEVVDAFLLEDAIDEVQIALAVLNQKFPLAVGVADQILEIGDAAFTQQVHHDLGDGLVLKDATLAVLPDEPERRTQHAAVAGEVAVLAHERELGHQTVELA